MGTIIYLRKSRADETKEDSLENHRKVLINLCKSKDWQYEILEEIGTSQSIDKRVQMTELISLIKQGKVNRVVVIDVDRLSRENYDLAYLRKLFVEYNIELVTPQKIYDWNNENDLMMFGFSSIIGENEYRQIRKRMLLGKQIGAESGIWVTGEPPLGYKKNRDTKILELVEEEVKLYRYIVECYLSGQYSNHSLSRHLNELGHRGRRGALWDAGRLHHLMNNKCYLGLVKYDGKWYQGKHEALITEEEWNKVQQQLKGNRIIAPRTTTKIKKKVSGLCKCGVCGRTMTVIVDYKRGKNFIKCHYKDKLTGARCGNRGIQEELIISHLENAIENHIEALEAYVNDGHNEYQNEQLKKYSKQIEDINNQIAKINNRIANTKEMAKEGILTLLEAKEEIKSCEANIQSLNESKEGIDYMINSLSKNKEKELATFKDGYKHLKEQKDTELYNEAIRSLINKVTVTRLADDVEIDINFL